MMQPIVSVVMITYGHENYISEAIRGVLMQKTDFPVEFIIANDHSPDNSDSVIKELIQNAPENITVKYHLHEKNIGMMPNFIWAFNQSKGKYVALCEGDDYWTDELKLQKQVDFLEQNEDYSICFHRTDDLLNGELVQLHYTFAGEQERTFTTSNIIKNNIIHTPSAVLRKTEKIPDWFLELQMGDYPLYLLTSLKGKIKYLPEMMAVYRAGVGVWGSKSTEFRELNLLKSLSVICKNFPDEKTKEQLEDNFFEKSQRFLNSIYPEYGNILKRKTGIQQKLRNAVNKIRRK